MTRGGGRADQWQRDDLRWGKHPFYLLSALVGMSIQKTKNAVHVRLPGQLAAGIVIDNTLTRLDRDRVTEVVGCGKHHPSRLHPDIVRLYPARSDTKACIG